VISVILTTHNRPDMCREAIDSVLAQEGVEFELVVVDDGSTDDTPAMLASYGDAIRVARKENGGVASARNVGIQLAKGNLLAFLDDDDLFLPGKLRIQAAYHEAHPEIGISYTDCERFDERGPAKTKARTRTARPREGMVFRAFVEKYFIIFSTMAVPRHVVEHTGGFDEDYLRQDDLDFMARVLEHYPAGYIDEKLIRRRKFIAPKTAAQVRRAGTEQLLYVEKLSARYAPEQLPPRWAARKRARAEEKLARACELEGDAIGARRHYRQAIALDPLPLRNYRRWALAGWRARGAGSGARNNPERAGGGDVVE
jgi:glycosyltransferase involved in cell wall biosynthesis